MKRGLIWALAILGFLLIGIYGFASWYFSGIIIESPTRSLVEATQDEAPPTALGFPEPESVSIDAGDVSLAGWFFKNPADAGCGVVFLHGYRSTRYQVVTFTPSLWKRGCDVLAYDARGHGDSSDAYHTFGYYEKQDAVAALDWLSARTGLPYGKLALFGISYGAATSIQAAPDVPDLGFIIADSPYSEMTEIVAYQGRQMFPSLAPIVEPGALLMTELRTGMDVQQTAPEETVAAAAMPILLIHSLTDEYTFSTHSEDIYANSNKDRTVLHLTDWGAAHGADVTVNPAGYEKLITDFLAEYAPDFGRAGLVTLPDCPAAGC